MRDGSRGPDGNLTAKAAGCGAWVLLGFVAIIGALAAWLSSCDPTFLEFGTERNDGTSSLRLPVTVEPRVGLSNSSVVTVSSSAFGPSQVVGVAVCLEEADTESAGEEACDQVQGARFAVGADGNLRATYAVPRVITVGGETHDCAARDVSCIVVAADASDYDVSGGQRISFRTDLGPADLAPVPARPNSDLLPALPPSFDGLPPGTTVEITASGFQPGEPLILATCAGFPEASAVNTCDPVDDEAIAALMTLTTAGVTRHADASGTATFTFVALAELETFGHSDEPRDCTLPMAGCSFVVSAAADTKRSAVVPYTLAP